MKETYKFIALVAIAICVLLCYAFVPEAGSGNMPLKQMGLEPVTHQREQELEEETDTMTTEPVDTATQRVLLFGDSMSTYLAYRLADYANQNGHCLTCVTWVSSGTHNWADTDTLDHYIQMVKPTHVFICLGSNELYTTDMKGSEKRIRAIMSKIAKIPAVWIGPPNWCKDNGYNKLLLRILGALKYYPSYKLTFERQADGRHPTMSASSMWMDKIIEWMNQGHSIHPFRMEKPTKKNRHYKQFTILPTGTKRKSKVATATVADSASRHAKPAEEPVPASHAAPTVAHKDSVK